jgi:hypothetical protein
MVAVAVGVLASGGPARAGNYDLQLLNLCPPTSSGTPECSWVGRNADGSLSGPVSPTADGQAAFRSLMSEMGVVIAPRLQTPADTLGYAGFQFSAEVGFTKINSSKSFWNGVEGHTAGAPAGTNSDTYLTTVGAFVRKGLWLPVPALEYGVGALNIVGTRMYAVQGYAKIALQEGFHGWWLPSFAVRGAVSQLLGTDQVDLTVFSIDGVISKAFGLAGTSRIEPFLGGNILLIDARSEVIDATPKCDAVAAEQGSDMAGNCAASQLGTSNDTFANFTFPEQSLITRYRLSGGFKLKMSVLFLVAEFDYTLAGKTNDGQQPTGQPQAVRDLSGGQQAYSLSFGFDF